MRILKIFIAIMLFAAVFLPLQAVSQISDEEPMDVQVTNLSAQGFTVSWTTESKTTGYVMWGDTPTNLESQSISQDVRGEGVELYTHYCNIGKVPPSSAEASPLNENTKYYFKIVSGESGVVYPSGQPMNASTLDFRVNTPPTSFPVYGKVKNSVGFEYGTIVYCNITDNLNAKTSLTMSTVAFTEGDWRINLNSARDPDTNDSFIWADHYADCVVNLRVVSTNGEKSRTYTLPSDTINQDTGTDVLPIPFALADGSVSPTSGDSEQEYSFSVRYTSSSGAAPTSVQVYIDGTPYDMTGAGTAYASGVTYTYSATLPEGNHSYYFRTITADNDVYTSGSGANEGSLLVTAPTTGGDGEDDDGPIDDDYYLPIIGIIVVIVIALLVIMMTNKAKKAPAKDEPTDGSGSTDGEPSGEGGGQEGNGPETGNEAGPKDDE